MDPTVRPIRIAAHDGRPLACYHYDAPARPLGAVVIAPAMAVAQSFYAHFARWLAGQGYAVRSFDYRGTGESLQGPKRGAPGTLDDWCRLDYDAVLAATHAEFPELPLFAVGHSFGGQCAPLLPSRHLLSGLVNIAVGSGAMRDNTPKIRRTAPWLWYLLVPLLCPVFGYFPGARIGVIGDVPSGAMRQWRRWCLSPDYLLGAEPGAREAYASARYPVLALTFADDELLLESGSRRIHDAYPRGQVDYRFVTAAAMGLERIGHVGFFRAIGEPRLWPQVKAWLDQRVAAAQPGPRIPA
jgi:predicted alpha/beta hydrolase